MKTCEACGAYTRNRATCLECGVKVPQPTADEMLEMISKLPIEEQRALYNHFLNKAGS